MYRKIRIVIIIFSLFIISCSHEFDGKNGTKTVYFPNTEIVCQKVEFKDGKRNGLLEEFYRNGNPKVKQHYKNDRLDDSSFFYYDNGQVSEMQYFKDSLKQGCWKKFNREGKRFEELNYKDNELNGLYTLYTYKTGRLLKRSNFEFGQPSGKQELYYNNGKPKSVTYFDHRKPSPGTEEWYENGEKVDNDFKITVEEQNKVLMENKLRYYIRLSNPQADDAVYMMADQDTGNVVTQVYALKRINDYFLLEYDIHRGGFIMEKVKLAAFRKTKMGNDIIKTTSFNATANNY